MSYSLGFLFSAGSLVLREHWEVSRGPGNVFLEHKGLLHPHHFMKTPLHIHKAPSLVGLGSQEASHF